jgi:hypothetical protein
MKRQPFLRTGEIHVDQLQRPPELPPEGVSVHEGGIRRGVAVVMVEGKLEYALQVRPVLAVVRFQAGELSLDERRRLARVERLEQAGERIASSPDHLVGSTRRRVAPDSPKP